MSGHSFRHNDCRNTESNRDNNMKRPINIDDIAQINRESLERLTKEDIISLALKLRDYGIELYERLNQNSSNSSLPPSSDSPFKGKSNDSNNSDKDEKTNDNKAIGENDEPKNDEPKNDEPKNNEPKNDENKNDEPKNNEPKNDENKNDKSKYNENKIDENQNDDAGNEESKSGELGSINEKKRSPGRQPGSPGFGRTQKPEPDNTVHHYPEECIICNNKLEKPVSPHTGFYTYELERKPNGIEITCTLNYYYSCICECGHENIEQPGEGYVSVLEGRKQNLKLSEYTIVGPMLATFIASLNRNYGMSRKKIQLYLKTWLNLEFSEGLICKTIREVGIACDPIVKELVEELQKEDQIHLDETPWYQKGIFCWIWVAISKTTAIYKVGTRKKEELLELITEAFLGWLITDGYGAYRSYEKRQRCLAHLIRKAVALTGSVSQEAQKAGDWFLKELRGLIEAMAQGEDGKIKCRPILARLKRACNLGKESDHAKLKSLAKEILNDWDAVVAFVKNPELPATNNEAERALRWVVLFRKITYGTRTDEGSRSFTSMLSVIETCRLRDVDPWEYIANVVAHARKGEIVSTPPIE